MKHLRGFDYVDYLKRHMLVGQLDPWRIDDDGKPFYALLTTLDFAMNECTGWSGQSLGRDEFKNYLALNNIWTLRNIEELQKVREEREAEKEVKKRSTRNYTPEQRKELSDRMKLLNQSRKASITKNPQ
jgi:hypothetical protein